jgi:hypothetical protein
MSAKYRMVKGSSASLIPSVDKLGLALNNRSDIRHVATLCGLN